MKIFVDSNNFIRSLIERHTCVCGHHDVCDLDHIEFEIIETPDSKYTCFYVPGYSSPKSIMDPIYKVPKYRWINNQAVEVTNPLDYQVDDHLWRTYVKYLSEEILDMIPEKSNTELKMMYDDSPDYAKAIIYRQINMYWSSFMPQWDMNLVLETMCRLLAEMMYIQRVEKRELTQDENTYIDGILTNLRQYSAPLKNDPLSSDPVLKTGAWPAFYLNSLLEISQQLRGECYAQRVFVTGADV